MCEIFIRKWSELSGGRWDCQYYNLQLFQSVKTYSLNKIADIKGGKRIPKGKSYSNTTTSFKYLRVDDINSDENELNIDILRSIDYEVFEILKRYEIFPNEIVLSNAGTIGKILLFKNNTSNKVVLTENCVKIQCCEKVLPNFLAIVLKTTFIQEQLKQNYIQTTIPKLAIERIKELKIPEIPSKQTQQKIIDIMDNAYKQKKQKEQEAQGLLDSIDEYLLNELGISLPSKDTKELEDRIYLTKFSQISEKRLDCEYHQSYYKSLERAISYTPYPLVNIVSLIKNLKKGIEVGSNQYSQNKEIPFIRVSDINNEGIDFEAVDKFISYSLYENLKDFQPKDNELLYSKDGTIGICLQADTSRDYIISGAILRLELKDDINLNFLQALLASHLMNILANRESIGAVIKHLNIDKFLNLKIPLPDLKIQEQIAHKILESKNKAFDLNQKAKEILQCAKIEVENLIITNGGGALNNVYNFELNFDEFNQYFNSIFALEFFKNMRSIWGGRYPLKMIRNIFTEITEFKYLHGDYVSYIEIGDIDINQADIKYKNIAQKFLPKNTKITISQGDLLISTVRPTRGAIAIYTKENEAYCSGAFCVLRQQQYSVMLLQFLLRTKLFKDLFAKFSTGSTYPTIKNENILNLKIPIPPMQVQERITKEINIRKTKALNLQNEAKELLESAKKEVENIILGG
ncbi:hypothetical protein CQA38_08195 [Campylobacter sp. MIT 12-5580]|uniref:restriction endonuclease subunit S n=1 Tax=Campylobacter sp. MIT 12-5580 TaxID=2040651 RepID=UPI0010F8627F|nr:restriction endonuclease subunit S [Campylobacter sp. MIT 12-5580]TKX28340.1 hypothetical protein CQA38_08195 [Campylobacter sp. MIT 12-5580]